MSNAISLCLLTMTLMLASACNKTTSSKASGTDNMASSSPVMIMTFNVENLFDTEDDPEKYDNTYLPLSAKQSDEHKAYCAQIDVDRWRDDCLNRDWNDHILERKLSVLAKAILQVRKGQGPDIIALQEIENIMILERLRTEYLQAAGYNPAILIEGKDDRGIDVAFLSRLPLHDEPQLHDYIGPDPDPNQIEDTRGFLEATFVLPDGSLMTGFAVHFPAPYHPTVKREAAYDQLNALKNALPGDRYVFAAGDFNTTSSEDRENQMLERFVHPHWTAVHELECDGCKGTAYYAREDSWSYLDMILWSAGEAQGTEGSWSIRDGSVMIANNTPDQVSEKGTPLRFQFPQGGGVSDHWPMVFEIKLK